MSDDVITDDFDVEVFLDLLHWSWEDAYNGTREIERPVSPFSQPVHRPSEPDVPPTEPAIAQHERESYEEQGLSVDSHAYSSSEDFGPLDGDESSGTIRSAAQSPAPCSFSNEQASPSTINYNISQSAQTSNLKRSVSSDADAPIPKRICRQIRIGLMSVTDAELNSTAEPPKNWKISSDQGLASCGHDHDIHNSSIADRISDGKPDGPYCDDCSERHEDSPPPESNVHWRKYR
ncbi:hypothetical protein FCOIX_5839 [Fusarium coicis]|nr:hypothetical protein FCOIX_5839 [Fusarium coicis]